MRRPKTLFIIADGARARLVARSSETGDFVTVAEMDGHRRLEQFRAEVRASPSPRNFQSGAPISHAVGREDPARDVKEAFIDEVADRAAGLCRTGGFEDVVVAAPRRLIGRLRTALDGRARIAAGVERDLTKTPNADLGRWFSQLPLP